MPAAAEPERAAQRDDDPSTSRRSSTRSTSRPGPAGRPTPRACLTFPPVRTRARVPSAAARTRGTRADRDGPLRDPRPSTSDTRRTHGQTRTWCASSPSASRSRSRRPRRSCAPPPSRGSCSCTGARKGSARPASPSCSRATTSSTTSYSTFALPDSEKDEGFTLLCRAHVYEDVTIELLNYDEEMIRSGLPIQNARSADRRLQRGSSPMIMRHLVLSTAAGAKRTPPVTFAGQYVDLGIPGTVDTRSFSMANCPLTADQRAAGVRHQGAIRAGCFSEFLDTRRRRRRRGSTVTGPFGVFTLRDSP